MNTFLMSMSSVFALWGLIASNLITFNESATLWIYTNTITIFWIYELFFHFTTIFFKQPEELRKLNHVPPRLVILLSM